MKDNKNKRLRLFDITRDGRGISKSEDMGNGVKRFFVTFKNNFNKLLTVNIIMVLGNFPLIFLIAALSGFTKADSYLPMHDLYQNLSGFFSNEGVSASTMLLYSLTGLHNHILVPTTLTYVFYGISALTLLTFGCVNVGTAYVLRNIASGEPVFVWSDFWYAVKRNWKQALPFGIIDVAINAILILNIYNMISAGSSSFLESTMMWANIIIFVLYFFMRFYVYVQMCTFKITIWKNFKNSLIFALLGFKRNIVAMLGILIALLLEVMFIFAFGGVLVSFGVALPFLLLFSTMAYMKVFASYYKIKEIMIDPYKAEHPDESDTPPDDDPVMTDDVTAAEKLSEAKRRNGISE